MTARLLSCSFVFAVFLFAVGIFLSTSAIADSEKVTASKTVRIGHSLTLLLFDSNLNRDSDKVESYTLDLIQFESDNIRTTLGPAGGVQDQFDPKPSMLRETGENSGIFYSVIKIPRTIDGKRIDVGEKIEFEYTQRGFGAFLALYQGEFSPDVLKLKDILEFKEKTESAQPIEIVCKEGFVKIFKYNGMPACVKPSTAEKLIERGWAKPNP